MEDKLSASRSKKVQISQTIQNGLKLKMDDLAEMFVRIKRTSPTHVFPL